MNKKKDNIKYKDVYDFLNRHITYLELDGDYIGIEEIIGKFDANTNIEFANILLKTIINDVDSRFTIKRCENCGKYFIPFSNNTLYCDNISPQKDNKTCKQYASKQPKGVQKLYRQVYSRLYQKYSRMGRLDLFDEWKTKANNVRNGYKHNRLTESEITNWLMKQK